MGWDYSHREPGISHIDWFSKEFQAANILACAPGKGQPNVLYMAIQSKDDPKKKVWAAVITIHWDKKSYCNFGYRFDEESCGPIYVKCPKKVFNLLTPLDDSDNDYAADWRNRVDEWHRTDTSFRLSKGMCFRTHLDFRFVGVGSFNIFMCTDPRKLHFRTITIVDGLCIVGGEIRFRSRETVMAAIKETWDNLGDLIVEIAPGTEVS